MVDQEGPGAIAQEMLNSKEFRTAVENQAAGATAPIGSIVAWSGETAPPGWAICKGQAFKVGWDTEGLRRALPSTSEDRLPDFQGYFLRGAGEAETGPGSFADLQSRSGSKGPDQDGFAGVIVTVDLFGEDGDDRPRKTLDLFSRKIVGWSMSDSLESTVVIDALQMAIDQRAPREQTLQVPSCSRLPRDAHIDGLAQEGS